MTNEERDIQLKLRVLQHAEKRRFQELLVDQVHQIEVHLTFAVRLIIERGPRDRQQRTFLAD